MPQFNCRKVEENKGRYHLNRKQTHNNPLVAAISLLSKPLKQSQVYYKLSIIARSKVAYKAMFKIRGAFSLATIVRVSTTKVKSTNNEGKDKDVSFNWNGIKN